jgi:hypothetical protein
VVAMLGNHPPNAGTFDDIGAQTVDVHGGIVAAPLCFFVPLWFQF